MEVIDELKSNLKKKFDEGFKKADEALSKAAPLVEMEKKTKINKVILIASTTSGILGLILIIANFGGDLITTSVAFVYPALKSLECLEKLKKEDVHQWVSYWVIMGFFNLLEFLRPFVLHFIPYYYLFKLGLILWLILPNTMGAGVIYNIGLKHLVKKPPPPPPPESEVKKFRQSAVSIGDLAYLPEPKPEKSKK